MEELALAFFPFPHVFRGRRSPGLLMDWPKPCLTCDRQCERATVTGLGLCSYGVNFQRIDQDLLIAGIVVREDDRMTKARKKAIRLVGKEAVPAALVETVMRRARESTEALEDELRARKDRLIAEYRESAGYQTEIVDQLRPEIQRALAQVHDYKQFVQQIIQNMNVILATRYGGSEVKEQLEVAEHEEAAVYWAARLMEEKLDAALYLMYPERIHELRDRSRFRFHGMVTKYRKIYQRRLESRNLTLRLTGESRGDLENNPRALAVIPHTLIDNAIKYSPEGSEIAIEFNETEASITFKVGSWGPRIHPDERERIFDLFYRGREASKLDSEGTGFGLASAQNVAKAIGSEIRVTQDRAPGTADVFWTVFSVEFELAPEPDQDDQRSRRSRRS